MTPSISQTGALNFDDRGLRAPLQRRPTVVRWVLILTFLGLVSPTVINYAPYRLAWDEAYYLNRAICMNHAFYDFSLSQVNQCLAHTHKGPIIELVNLPWGRAGGSNWGIGLAFVGLALLIWLVVLATYLACVRSCIPPSCLLLAAASICLTPFLRITGGAMMVDTLLGWCIALTLLLIPLEYNDPETGLWPSVLRGFLWGFVADVGMLSKVTFGFFLVVVGMAVIAIRQRCSGRRPLFYSLAGCLVASMPAIVIWWMYGWKLLGFAVSAAWGGYAPFFNVPDMTAAGYFKRYIIQLGWAPIPLLLLIALFIRGLVVEKRGRIVRLFPFAIILAYLAIATRSLNRDARFTIPVMIAMPLSLAWTSAKKTSGTTVGATPILAALLVGTLCAIPMVGKPEITPIQHTHELLGTLSQGRPITVVIATDGPEFNIDTFMLAREISPDSLRQVELDTLVYDEINKRSLEDGLKRIDAADYVLFLRPGIPPGADWMRTHAQEYRAHCERVGILISAGTSLDFDVFKIPKP